MIPEAYVLVPKEPTDAMLRAYVETARRNMQGKPMWDDAIERYQAMLAAAPLMNK